MNKPIVTLFMLMSVDGKISTGSTDDLDMDKNFPRIKGVKEGLFQYYKIEKETDLHFLITGAVMAKKSEGLNVNNRIDKPKKISINYIIIDNKNLTASGVRYLLQKFNSLTVVTTNEFHPANEIMSENLKIEYYKSEINFPDLFEKLKSVYGIKFLTIQSGGTLNSVLLREKLIDKISIVIAPVLIGGKDTASLIDGQSLVTSQELNKIKALKLTDVKKLKNSYIYLKYNVINNTRIE